MFFLESLVGLSDFRTESGGIDAIGRAIRYSFTRLSCQLGVVEDMGVEAID